MLREKLGAGVAVHPGGAHLALVALRPAPTLLRCDEVTIQPGEESRLGALVIQALDRMGARQADVHLGFAPHGAGSSKHHLFTAPRLRKAELRQVAARELKRDASIDPERMCHAVMELDGEDLEGGGRVQRYLLAGVGKEVLEAVATELVAAKFVVRSGTTAALGLLRAAPLAAVPPGVSALALVEPRRTVLMVVEDGLPRFFREFPNPVVKDEGEEAHVQALGREIDLSLVYYAQQNRPKAAEAVLLAGGSPLLDRLADWLAAEKSYEVSLFEPGERLPAQEGARPERLEVFAPAIGLALGQRTRHLPDVLPAHLHTQPERLLAVAAAGAFVLVLAVVVSVMRSAAVDAVEREREALQTAQRELALLEPLVRTAMQKDRQNAGAEAWRDFLDATGAYHRRLDTLLVQLTAAMPPRMRLTSLSWAAPSVAALAAPAAPAAPGAPARPVLARLRLEGLVQADLATAQAELRQLVKSAEALPGVKHVDLAPLPSSTTTDLPFALDLSVDNVFPGARK